MNDTVCYHCGLSLPASSVWQVTIAGTPRSMCCPGCQAVAQAIVDGGMADYYRHRDAMPKSPREALPAALDELRLFDLPAVQRDFVRAPAPGEREADLILEGITCAACVWLNESHLSRQPGVLAVHVNYATQRARVRWREADTQLSDILAAIAAIGYRAHPYDAARSEEVARRTRREALWRLFVAGFGMMQVMMYAYPAYIAGEGELSPLAASIMRWASLILTVPVVGYSAAPFFARAWRDLRLRRLGMDVPVALGIGAAFLASVWSTLFSSGEVYFDSVTMFVFFLLVARYAEMLARMRAVRGAEMLARSVPALARRRLAGGGSERVPVAELVCGDVLVVWPGEAIPADGVVIAGVSSVDESLLSGESRPLVRDVGDVVLCGSVNGDSPLEVRATAVAQHTRIAAIRTLMERAAQERPGVVLLADRVAAKFVGVVLLLALLAGVVWWWIEPARALWIAVSVLVVSCPCALSLSTPAALTVASEAFLRQGLLVTRGHAIETLARVDHVVFDKTGTLTHGRLQLAELRCAEGVQREEALASAAALEQDAGHAIAQAIIAATSVGWPQADSIVAVAGQGVSGRIAGVPHAIGRAAFVARHLDLPAPPWSALDNDVVLASAQGWLAAFSFADALREDACSTVARLQADACAVSIFSGDASASVDHVAARLLVSDARAAMLPEDKHAALTALQAQGHVVAMVGDGINDAPVLAQAHVSVALGSGAELARTQADIVLLGAGLTPLVEARRLARRTLLVIRQNLVWAAAYNLLSIPAAMAGWVSPWLAGIGMGLSSLLVVLNALRLVRN